MRRPINIQTRFAADIVWNIWLVGGIVLGIVTGRFALLFMMMAGGLVMGWLMIWNGEKDE